MGYPGYSPKCKHVLVSHDFLGRRWYDDDTHSASVDYTYWATNSARHAPSSSYHTRSSDGGGMRPGRKKERGRGEGERTSS